MVENLKIPKHMSSFASVLKHITLPLIKNVNGHHVIQNFLKFFTDKDHIKVAELKKKQDAQAQLLRQKQKSDEAAKRLQDDIQRIKTQKVQLQQKIKQESEQFRLWKVSREKEVLQKRRKKLLLSPCQNLRKQLRQLP